MRDTIKGIGFIMLILFFMPRFFLNSAGAAVPVICNLQQDACSFVTGSGTTIQFDIQPKPVKSMSDLNFIVALQENDKAVSNASVPLNLSMPGMYMGTNAPVMKPTGNGRYEGTGTITRCMSRKKTWQADITIHRGDALQSASFVFEVQ